MNRNYPLLRLSPDQAGKLQHDFNRLQASHTRLETELAALEHTMRTTYGSHAWLTLRKTSRNQAMGALLKQEITA